MDIENKKQAPVLNYRYHNGEIDDDLPYVGELKLDEASGKVYDEDGDVLDAKSFLALCGEGDGRGDDEVE